MKDYKVTSSIIGAELETKVCTKCKIEQPVSAYAKDSSRKDGFVSNCRDCKREMQKLSRQRNPELYKNMAKKYRDANPDKLLTSRYKTIHGITYEEFKEILSSQGGVCKICKATPTGDRAWVVDHDHSCCGNIKSCNKCRRGILCQACNKALGFIRDDIQILENAIKYLEKYKGDE
jgi:hypothetical protein